jgi:hypothetical protein
MRRSVYCTALFSVCSLRRAKFPIIYPDLGFDYKVATHPKFLQVCCWHPCFGGRDKGLQDALAAALFRAYFTEGRDIGKNEVLTQIAAEAGLSKATKDWCY